MGVWQQVSTLDLHCAPSIQVIWIAQAPIPMTIILIFEPWVPVSSSSTNNPIHRLRAMNSSYQKSSYQGAKQEGYLIIEALVALAIFSIALLSLAGAQMTTSKNTFSSMLKTESAIKSSELIDKMRLNLGGVAAGQYTLAYGTDVGGISPSNQGETDLVAWMDAVQTSALLGTSPDAEITCVGLNCTIAIRWSDVRASGGTDVSSLTQYLYTTDINL